MARRRQASRPASADCGSVDTIYLYHTVIISLLKVIKELVDAPGPGRPAGAGRGFGIRLSPK